MSKHVIKLNVVDLIGGLSLESSENNVVLLLRDSHLEVVKDGSETGKGNETRAAAVLILEVRLNQKTTVLDISTKSSEACNQNLLLLVVEYILGVKD